MPDITYSVTVNDSYDINSGAGDYQEEETVTIRAGERDGYGFNKWTSSGVVIPSPEARTTKFIMPANAVILLAEWQPEEPEEPEYIYPPTTIYVHELNKYFEAVESVENPGIFVVESITLPSNPTDKDIVYTFEVCVNYIPTGIIGYVTVYFTTVQVMEVSQIIITPDKLGPKGGDVSVRIEFKIPTP